MDIQQFHEELASLTATIHAHGLNGDAHAYVNWLGEELQVEVEAKEPYDEKGYWRSQKSFVGKAEDAASLLASAKMWIAGIPDEERRAAELMIRKLNEMADKLPSGSNDVAQAAWAELSKMFIAKAGRIAQNGLPSPERIRDISDATRNASGAA